jgi:hypothetical protein
MAIFQLLSLADRPYICFKIVKNLEDYSFRLMDASLGCAAQSIATFLFVLVPAGQIQFGSISGEAGGWHAQSPNQTTRPIGSLNRKMRY